MTDDDRGRERAASGDEAWLLARERGEPAASAPSAEIRRAYDRLERALAALPPLPTAFAAGAAGDAAWQARVLDEIDAAPRLAAASMPIPIVRPADRPRRVARWLALAAPALAAAAAVALWLGRSPPGPGTGLDDLAVDIRPGASPHRGGALAAVGDVLEVRAPAAGELRVYRDERSLVVRCPGGSGCRRDGDSLAVSWPLTAPGRYRVVALAAAAAPPSGVIDDDLAAAAQSGIRVTLAPALDVQ